MSSDGNVGSEGKHTKALSEITVAFTITILCFFTLGCSVDVEVVGKKYSALNSNKILAKLYQKHAESFGVTFLSEKDAENAVLGSTDMGNVSVIKPSIHPVFSINNSAVIHTRQFNTDAAKDEAQPRTLVAGKSMAMTAIEVLGDPQLLQTIVNEFNENKDN